MKRRRSLLYIAFTLALLICFLNYLAIMLYLYWTSFWYDYMMHFLGGVSIAVMAMWLLGVNERNRKNFWPVLIVVMAVGVGWEIFEYFIKAVPSPLQSYKVDTTHDLIMDAIGGVVAYFTLTRNSISKEASETTSAQPL